MVIILESFFALLFIVFHNYLPQLFLDTHNSKEILNNTEIISITSKLLLIAAVFQISDGVQVVVLGALRGIQDVKIPMYITFIAYWMVGFPISYYLCKHTDFKVVGIWIGLCAGLSVAALFLYIRFAKLVKNKL
jgi:MATE family multidrug resistance protein